MTLETLAHSEVLAPFFLLVGMQLRNEITHIRQVLLPTIAALGGMAFPAIIFYVMNHSSHNSQGWPVVMPTDIALVMTVLLFMGKRVSVELKTFLLAIAVADDLFSIVILGMRYSSALKSSQWLASIGAVVLGTLLWKIPGQIWLTRFVNFFVLPIYIFANLYPTLTQDFSISSHLGTSIVISRVTGKAFGILLFTWLVVKLRISQLPKGLSLGEVLAGGLLAGMGLAVSFLIANLTFSDPTALAQVRSGLLVAVLVSALAGSSVLAFIRKK